MQEIKIRITKDGQVTYETQGFQGQSCEQIVQQVMVSNGKVEEDTNKPEYYDSVPEFINNISN